MGDLIYFKQNNTMHRHLEVIYCNLLETSHAAVDETVGGVHVSCLPTFIKNNNMV